MIANSSSWRALHSAFAPTSSSTVRPARFGTTAASAGRSTPSSVPSVILAIAQQAAVLPAEKKASAAPSRTRSSATWIEERFLSVERLTFSLIPTLSGASTTSIVRRLPAAAELAAQQRLRAHQGHPHAQLAAREPGALDGHRGAVVATHGVHGHPGLRH